TGALPAHFRVQAVTDGAQPVSWDIDQDGKYAGNIVVQPTFNNTQYHVASVEVRVHSSYTGFACTAITRYDVLPAALGLQTVANPNLSVRFNNLDADRDVFATVV